MTDDPRLVEDLAVNGFRNPSAFGTAALLATLDEERQLEGLLHRALDQVVRLRECSHWDDWICQWQKTVAHLRFATSILKTVGLLRPQSLAVSAVLAQLDEIQADYYAFGSSMWQDRQTIAAVLNSDEHLLRAKGMFLVSSGVGGRERALATRVFWPSALNGKYPEWPAVDNDFNGSFENLAPEWRGASWRLAPALLLLAAHDLAELDSFETTNIDLLDLAKSMGVPEGRLWGRHAGEWILVIEDLKHKEQFPSSDMVSLLWDHFPLSPTLQLERSIWEDEQGDHSSAAEHLLPALFARPDSATYWNSMRVICRHMDLPAESAAAGLIASGIKQY